MSKRVDEIKSFFNTPIGVYGIKPQSTYFLHFENLHNKGEYNVYFANYNIRVGCDDQTNFHELSLRKKKIIIDDNDISDEKIIEKIIPQNSHIDDTGTVTYTNETDIKEAIKKLKGNLSPTLVFNRK